MKLVKQKLSSFITAFSLVDICLILLLCSRFYTKILTTILGGKGIFVSMGILAVLYLAGMISNIRKKDYRFAVFFTVAFFIGTLTFASLGNHPEVKYWIFNYDWGLFVKILDVRKSVWAFLAILLVANTSKIDRDLRVSAWLMAIYCIIQIVVYWMTGNWDFYYNTSGNTGQEALYNMSLGYEMVFSAVVLIVNWWNNKKPLYAIGALVFTSMSIFYGSRGLLVNFAILAGLLFFFKAYGKREKLKAALQLTVGIVAVVGLLYAQNYVVKSLDESSLTAVSSTSAEMGSRTLGMASNGGLANSNGRFDIWHISGSQILHGGIFGHGLFGDRPFVGQEYQWGYSHQIFVEVLVSFGIAGAIWLIYLAFMSFRILHDRETPYKDSFIIFFALSTKLLISDSIWFLNFFWAYLALIWLYNHEGLSFNLKREGTLMATCAATCLICLGLFVHKDIKNQSFKVITFDKPEAIVAFDDGMSPLHAEEYNYLIDNNIPATAFVKTDELLDMTQGASKQYLDYLMDHNIGFENGGVDTKSLTKVRHHNMDVRVQISEAVMELLGIQKPVAYLPSWGKTNAAITYNLQKHYRFILNYKFEAGSGSVYHSLNGPQATDIYAVVIPDEPQMGDLKKVKAKIDQAVDRKALIVVMAPKSYDEINSDFFKDVIDYLKEKNVSFTNFRELDRASQISEKEKTLSNYLKSTPLAHYLH